MLAVLLIPFIFLFGCSNISGKALVAKPTVIKNMRLAVYPVTNLSGTKVPLKETSQLLIEKLQTQGVDIVSDAALEKFLARHRIRYMGGLSVKEAELFKEELETDAVLIVSYELYDDSPPPKIALTARLISAGSRPTILWADSVGLAGDDSPGILGLGLILDPQKLLDKAVQYLSGSLTEYWSRDERVRGYERGLALEGGKEAQRMMTVTSPVVGSFTVTSPVTVASPVIGSFEKLFGSFMPKSYYAAPFLEPHKRYSVAVTPFQNRSGMKNAGNIVMYEFIRHLSAVKDFTVIDPGMVRQEMLDERIIMLDSVSLADADLIFNGLDADLVVTGVVTDYYDYNGPGGTCRVGFSVLVIDKKERKTVFAADSYNTGDERIVAFDLGKIRTAPALASKMIRVIVELLSTELYART